MQKQSGYNTVPNLPDAPDVERLVLGALLTDPSAPEPILALQDHDFSLDAHRRILNAARWLYDHGQQIDRITVAERLREQRQLDSVGGLAYIVDLDTGLPQIYGLESYLGTLRLKSTLRRAAKEAFSLAERLCLPGADVDEIRAAEAFLRDVASYADGPKVTLRSLAEAMERAGGIDAFVKPSYGSAVPSPWARLNAMLTGGGFRAGQLIVIGARPGMGKSALAALVAREAAESTGVAVFSLEMADREIWLRMLASLTAESVRRIERGEVKDLVLVCNWLANKALYIDDSTGANVPAIVQAAKRRGGIGLIVIDYLQLLAPVRRTQNRNEAVSEISRALKLAARELRVPVIVLSQLNREMAKETREPELHDLRDSGSIEQDADIVMFLHTDPKEREAAFRDRRPSELSLLVKKQRNGRVGKVKLLFSPWNMQMIEVQDGGLDDVD